MENTTNHLGETPLLFAVANARYGVAPVVPLLLAAGANPNVAHPNGLTPLLIAVQNQEPDIVRLLLENGADPNATTPDGKTAQELLEARQASAAPASAFQQPSQAITTRPGGPVPQLLRGSQPSSPLPSASSATRPPDEIISELLQEHGRVPQ